ncbi:MAG: hypothetical protein ACOCQE_03310 [Halanaerobium sp.]
MLIFKENNRDYREKIFKYLFIITAAVLLTAYLSSFYLNKIESELSKEIEYNSRQLKKYKYLISKKNNQGSDISTYQFLEKAVIYAENIVLENLYLDQKKMIICAETEQEKYVFEFLDKLKEDDIFLKTELKEIENNRMFNFTIRADLISR